MGFTSDVGHAHLAAWSRPWTSSLDRRIARRVKSVTDLQDAITRYVRAHNKAAKPFVWSKAADDILAKLDRLPAPSE